MTLVLRTTADNVDHTEIVGVGMVPAYGHGGQPLSRCAAVMQELQDGEGAPLTGKELEAAAAAWTALRGMEVADVSFTEDYLAVMNGASGVLPELQGISIDTAQAEGHASPAPKAKRPNTTEKEGDA